MRPRHLARIVAAVTLLLGLPAPGAAAQDGGALVAPALDVATPVSAYGDVAAWSERDPATGRFALTILDDGQVRAAAVPQRLVPFDADVGPGADGEPVVVYSRCDVEPLPRIALGLSIPLDFAAGRGCDLFAYDVGTRLESPLGVSTSADEVLPAIWGRRVTFVERTGGGALVVRVGNVDGGQVSQRVGRPRGGSPRWIDMSGGRAAILWRTPRGAQLRIGTRVVARSRRFGGLLGMGFDNGVLFYRTTCPGSVPGCDEAYWAYRPRSRARFVAVQSADLVAAAHGGGHTYAVTGTDGGGVIGCSAEHACDLVREPRISFEAVPRR